MVLTKSELTGSLQNEVRILLHLAGKIDRAKLDYRPTPKQRSTIELLQYLTVMGPELIKAAKAGAFDVPAWTAAEQSATTRDFDQTLAALAQQTDAYAALLADVSDADLRAEITMFGMKSSRGVVPRQPRAVWMRGLPDPVVSLPQGVRPRRARHDEPVGGHGCPSHHIGVRRVKHLSRRSQHPAIQRGVAADVYRRLGLVPP